MVNHARNDQAINIILTTPHNQGKQMTEPSKIDLIYYKTVAQNVNSPECLRAELKDLIADVEKERTTRSGISSALPLARTNKASPVEMRKTLKVVNVLKKAMIQFVPLPVLSAEDEKWLIAELNRRLNTLNDKVNHDQE